MIDGSKGPPGDEATAVSADCLEDFRRQLVEGLPKLLDKAIAGYRSYTSDPPPEDPKGFLAYQAGCRAALAHVHLLVKLAQWAREIGAQTAPALGNEHLDLLLRGAEAALRDEALDED